VILASGRWLSDASRGDVMMVRKPVNSSHPKTEQSSGTSPQGGETAQAVDSDDSKIRISNLITIVCTGAGVSGVFFHEKFVASVVLIIIGASLILYASLERQLGRRVAVIVGCVLILEGIAFFVYRAIQPDELPRAAAIAPLARASLNDAKDEHYPVLQVAKSGVDPSCEKCWQPNMSAEPGDEVSFGIRVVNTSSPAAAPSGVTARNVTVTFATEQKANGLLGTARISAENAASVASAGQIEVPESYRDVHFSALWGAEGYRYSKSKWIKTEPPGVPPTLYLGDVSPGIPNQRMVVLRYRVDGTPAPGVKTGCLPLFARTVGTGVISANLGELGGAAPSDITRSWFDFGTAASLGWSVADAGGGLGTVRALQPGTKYYFRYVAQNACGLTAFGDTLSFTTPR
jgi:hypothetical protein